MSLPKNSPASLSAEVKRPIGVVGVGLIGSALVERLLGAKFSVVGFDVSAGCMQTLRELGGQAAASAGDVLARCDRVLFSLPSHVEVNAVIASCQAGLRQGLTIIDTTTGDPVTTVELAEALAAKGVTYLDATISGSSAQVRAGTVAIMVGGPADAFAACSDLFACFGRQTFHTGVAGTGAKMKLVTNLVLGLNRAALAEGLALADAVGLAPELTLAVMRASAAYSRIMDTKGERMINQEFSPDARLSQHLKDVRLIVETGQLSGLSMPLSLAHQAVLEQAERAGWGELDNSAIVKVLMAVAEKGTRS